MSKRIGLRGLTAVVVAVAICLFGRGGVHHVSAHAALISTTPANGVSLTEAPTEIAFEFTETLDPALTSVDLIDADRQTVAEGTGTIDATDPKVLRFALPELTNGTYSAAWQVRSAVDGHVTFGVVAFSVGAESSAASLLLPVGTVEPATALPTPLEAFLRYWNLISAAVAGGPLFFAVWVWLSTRRLADETDQRVTRLLRRLSQMGLIGLALGTLGFAILQATQTAPEAWVGAMFAGRTSSLLGVRLVVVAVLFVLVWRLPSIALRPGLWWVAAGVMGVVLLTFSLQSHSAAMGGVQTVVATAADLTHILAMVAWLGGLLPLALLLRPGWLEQDVRKALIPRFSRVALISVMTLAVTGFYSAWIHVRTLEALQATTYGRMVSAKTVLFALLIGLGAINLRVLSPRLTKAAQEGVGWLRRTVRVEMALGLVVLLAVGVLTAVAPARNALEAQRRLGFTEAARLDDVSMTLRVAPAQVGDNEFGVDIVDDRPGVEAAAPIVLLRFDTEAADGTTQVETVDGGDGRFTARGSYLGIAGVWEVQVILRRSGFDDVVHIFSLPVNGDVASVLE